MKKGFLFLALVLSAVISLRAQLPLSTNMAASGVLGAPDFVTNTNYATPSTTTLAEPAGVAVDPLTGKLFVADRDNRRVLRWSSAAKMLNGSAAEAVLGQPDFVTRTRNTGGLSASTTNDPNGVFVDANGRLWVADMTNNRVLRFDNASAIASASAANGVLGQPDFVTNSTGTTAGKMNNPTSVFVDANGALWVADRANNRVLKFNNAASKPNGASADVVLGQADFTTSTTGTSASTLNAPWGVTGDNGGRLWIADRGNSRVLRFDAAASKTNGAAANGVLGQRNFTSGTFNKTQDGLGEPRGVAVDGLGRLFVADEGNTRIMVYNNAAALANGSNADYVLGQKDFTSDVSSPISSSSLNYPISLCIDIAGNAVWVPDIYNHRVLRFSVAPLPVELTSFTGIVKQGKVELTWTTATELNNAGFEVEKLSGGAWVKIGYVKGNGTSAEPKQYSFQDDMTAGKCSYRLKQIDNDGSYKYSNAVEVTGALTAGDYKLGQNYPNPFNPSTTISFIMQNTEKVTLTVYNVLGVKVAALFDGVAAANQKYTVNFNAKNLASGTYFYSLRSTSRNEIKKMSLIK
jgi:sugar lactone lactonase YvrE